MAGKSENLTVFVRVRPPISKEVKEQYAVNVTGPRNVTLTNDKSEVKCSYNCVFSETTEQIQVFQKVQPLLDDVLNGINACIFAYGQTSAGKSYTMLGPNGGLDVLRCDRKLWGILPRASEYLLGALNKRAEDGSATFSVKASFLQIYNEILYDLLRDSGPMIDDHLVLNDRTGGDYELKIRELPKPKGGRSEVFVSGLSEFRVQTIDDILRILAFGTNNRMTRSTDYNATSSRSHAILQLSFEIEGVEDGQTTIYRSKLNLVDLAGSEKNSLENPGNEQKHLRELTSINKSLSCLGNVIAALSSTSRPHVPFRDSKLTRILQDSLSGNTRTILIACVAPTILHAAETLSTLQFSDRAKSAMLTVKATTFVDDRVVLEKAQSEIARLKSLLSHALKQNEQNTSKSVDGTVGVGGVVIGGSGDGVELNKLLKENDDLRKDNKALRLILKSKIAAQEHQAAAAAEVARTQSSGLNDGQFFSLLPDINTNQVHNNSKRKKRRAKSASRSTRTNNNDKNSSNKQPGLRVKSTDGLLDTNVLNLLNTPKILRNNSFVAYIHDSPHASTPVKSSPYLQQANSSKTSKSKKIRNPETNDGWTSNRTDLGISSSELAAQLAAPTSIADILQQARQSQLPQPQQQQSQQSQHQVVVSSNADDTHQSRSIEQSNDIFASFLYGANNNNNQQPQQAMSEEKEVESSKTAADPLSGKTNEERVKELNRMLQEANNKMKLYLESASNNASSNNKQLNDLSVVSFSNDDSARGHSSNATAKLHNSNNNNSSNSSREAPTIHSARMNNSSGNANVVANFGNDSITLSEYTPFQGGFAALEEEQDHYESDFDSKNNSNNNTNVVNTAVNSARDDHPVEQESYHNDYHNTKLKSASNSSINVNHVTNTSARNSNSNLSSSRNNSDRGIAITPQTQRTTLTANTTSHNNSGFNTARSNGYVDSPTTAAAATNRILMNKIVGKSAEYDMLNRNRINVAGSSSANASASAGKAVAKSFDSAVENSARVAANPASNQTAATTITITTNNNSTNHSQSQRDVDLQHNKSDVGRRLQMFSFRMNAWDVVTVVDYEASNKLHKVAMPDNTTQWLDLSKKPIRPL